METKSFLLKVVFDTPLLGSQPQRDVVTEFLAAKVAKENEGFEVPQDELEALPEKLEKGTTAFHRDPKGRPCLFDYQVKGFIKESGRIFNGMDGVKALRSKVDNYLFIDPRIIPLHWNNGQEMEFLERPLRAETMQGPRVTLARSEMLPVGTWFECVIDLIKVGPITEHMLRELLEYGSKKGLGQWRNGGYGRFQYTLTEMAVEEAENGD